MIHWRIEPMNMPAATFLRGIGGSYVVQALVILENQTSKCLALRGAIVLWYVLKDVRGCQDMRKPCIDLLDALTFMLHLRLPAGSIRWRLYRFCWCSGISQLRKCQKHSIPRMCTKMHLLFTSALQSIGLSECNKTSLSAWRVCLRRASLVGTSKIQV